MFLKMRMLTLQYILFQNQKNRNIKYLILVTG